MRRMNTMMNSFFRDPFGDMMGRNMGTELMPFGVAARGRPLEVARFDDFGMGFPMMPMGFPNLRSVFHDMGNNPNCHSFTSSTVMTMTPGPDGRPQVHAQLIFTLLLGRIVCVLYSHDVSSSYGTGPKLPNDSVLLFKTIDRISSAREIFECTQFSAYQNRKSTS